MLKQAYLENRGLPPRKKGSRNAVPGTGPKSGPLKRDLFRGRYMIRRKTGKIFGGYNRRAETMTPKEFYAELDASQHDV